jgi:hypothetical protein
MYVSKQNLLSFIQNSELNETNLDEKNLRYIDAEEDLFILTKKNENKTIENVEANGIIFEKNTKKIICTNQNYFEKIENKKIIDFPQNSIFEYIEDGTVIRLYYNKIWKTATSNCSDAKYSFWGSNISFDEQFWEIFDKRDLKSLDKKNTYIFILKHKESERIVKYVKNELIFISSISNINGYENVNYFKEPTFTVFKRPQKIQRNWQQARYLVSRYKSSSNIQEDGMISFDENIYHEVYNLLIPFFLDSFEPDFKILLNDCTASAKKIDPDDEYENVPIFNFHFHNKKLVKLESLDDYYHPFKRGILVKIPQENGTYTAYQFDFEKYQTIDKIRGNVPTLNDRFLELYLNKDFKSIRFLEKYYKTSSNSIKESLFNLYKTVFDLYSKTHKLHLFKVDETNKYYTTLKQIHALFYKKNNKNIDSDITEKPSLETIKENEVLSSEKKMIGITYHDTVNHINSLVYNIVKNLI